jgi:hypothetical protein
MPEAMLPGKTRGQIEPALGASSDLAGAWFGFSGHRP